LVGFAGMFVTSCDELRNPAAAVESGGEKGCARWLGDIAVNGPVDQVMMMIKFKCSVSRPSSDDAVVCSLVECS
jgi:hypothetical protein